MESNNVQNMREALTRLRELVEELSIQREPMDCAQYCWAIQVIDNALKSPRNCDKFTESEKALTKFMVENPNELMDKQTIWKFSEWLYASK